MGGGLGGPSSGGINYFDDDSTEKIVKAVRIVLSQNPNLAGGNYNLRDEDYVFRLGKLDEAITSESSGTVSIWTVSDSGGFSDSGDNVEAWNWSESDYDSGIKVWLICNGVAWVVISADCNE